VGRGGGGGEERCIRYTVCLGKHEGKRKPGRPGRRWEDYIKIYLQEVVLGGGGLGLDLFGSVQGQVAGARKCGDKIPGSTKCGEILD